jgi:hypothetical protein
MEVRQLPRRDDRAVLTWQDEAGNLEARAVLTVGEERVNVAYRWRDGERWLSRNFHVAFRRARTPAGGHYRLWQCPPPTKKGCGKGAKVLYEACGSVIVVATSGLFRIRVKSSNLSATSWFPVFDDRSVGALPFWLSQHETLLAGIYDAGLVLIQP